VFEHPEIGDDARFEGVHRFYIIQYSFIIKTCHFKVIICVSVLLDQGVVPPLAKCELLRFGESSVAFTLTSLPIATVVHVLQP
jgi:hypothetical protein